jgi:hypothetical protein
MDNNITAVCISRRPEAWDIPEIPFLCFTDNWKPFGHERSKERIAYLAERRNNAVTKALSLFPATQHILMLDSHYLHLKEGLRKLVSEYVELSSRTEFRNCIVGASTWIRDKTRLKSRTSFYDTWTTPEGLGIDWKTARSIGGIIRVKAVGGCYVYPRYIWERVSYGAPDDLHGCEHNWLCEKSMLPVLLSFDIMLWREREGTVYSWPKRLRMSLHLGRFLNFR